MCERIVLPTGQAAIGCGGHARNRQCKCGRRAMLQCDWKVAGRKSGTCDAWICTNCATSPAPDKDLCRQHTAAWEAWRAERTRDPDSGPGRHGRPSSEKEEACR